MDTLHARTITDLRAVTGDLVESLVGTFPECSELKEWCEFLNGELEREGDELQSFILRVTSYLTTTIPHKMVKYDRAVLSITGNPLNVYQTLMYRDAGSVVKVFPRLKALQMEDKIKSLSKDDAGMFWQFVHEAIQLITAETTCEAMRTNFPELGTKDEYSEESLSLARRIGSLCTMKNAIPTNMMNGIEKVASTLVRDINNGKVDFASLDVESIGEQVLNGVGEGDVNDFANNLEKILPALQSMGGLGK